MIKQEVNVFPLISHTDICYIYSRFEMQPELPNIGLACNEEYFKCFLKLCTINRMKVKTY